MDHCGGGGNIQPPDGLAMAPLQNYHSEKIGIVHCLIGSHFHLWLEVADFPVKAQPWKAALTGATRESVSHTTGPKYLPEDCKNLRARLR